jgi:hypothetical protein
MPSGCLQVADTLAETSLPRWLELVADRIEKDVWKGKQAEGDLCELLSLPPHLLHAAMSTWRGLKGPDMEKSYQQAASWAPWSFNQFFHWNPR